MVKLFLNDFDRVCLCLSSKLHNQKKHIDFVSLKVLRDAGTFLVNRIQFKFLGFGKWRSSLKNILATEEDILFKLALVDEVLYNLSSFLLCNVINVLDELKHALEIKDLENRS